MKAYQQTWIINPSQKLIKVTAEQASKLTPFVKRGRKRAKYYCMVELDDKTTAVKYFI